MFHHLQQHLKNKHSDFCRVANFLLLLFSANCQDTTETINWSRIVHNDTLALFYKDIYMGESSMQRIFDRKNRKIVLKNSIRVIPDPKIPDNISPMKLTEICEYTFDGKQIRGFQELVSPTGKSTWELIKDSIGEWGLTVTTGGMKKSKKIDSVYGNLNALYAIYLGVNKHNITRDQEWRDTVFSLISAKNIYITTKCIHTPTRDNPNYIFLNRDNLGVEDRWEIDKDGRLVATKSGQSIIGRRYGSEHGSGEKGESHFSNLLDKSKIPMKRGQRKNEAIALNLKSDAKVQSSVNRFYKNKNSTYILKNMPEVCNSSLKDKNIKNKEKWLSSTVTIQSDHPEIQKLANTLKRYKNDRCEIISHFNKYVFENIEKRNIATFSNAYETLKSGVGDCGEHATLLTALLRSVGIESNVVIGLVYVPIKKGYFYHSWVTAWVDDLLFVDPALGKFPVSEGYVPLILDDDGTHFIQISPLIDNIEVSYVKK